MVKRKGYIHTYTGCPRRNVPDFGRVFLMLKYTDITQNTYVQSWTVTEIMLISVLNIKLTCEWHKAIKLNYKNTRTHVIVVLRVPSTIHDTWMPSSDVTWLTTSSPWRKYICSLRLAWAELPSLTPHSRTDMDKTVSWQVQCVDPPEDRTFLWPLSPSPFNFGHRCFGLYRYTLT